jgi:hypothetical protein
VVKGRDIMVELGKRWKEAKDKERVQMEAKYQPSRRSSHASQFR